MAPYAMGSKIRQKRTTTPLPHGLPLANDQPAKLNTPPKTRNAIAVAGEESPGKLLPVAAATATAKPKPVAMRPKTTDTAPAASTGVGGGAAKFDLGSEDGSAFIVLKRRRYAWRVRAVLVVNPRASTTIPQSRALLIAALERELDLTVEETGHRGHASELAAGLAEATARGELDLVIAHGGDGTVNELVSGLLGPPGKFGAGGAGAAPTVAVIPGGSANVFARSLGISPDPSRAVGQFLEALRAGARRRVSVGLCDSRFEDGRHEERWFICNAGLGIDADVIAMMEAGRRAGRPVTPARYLLATVAAFFRWAFRPGPLTLELPGEAPVDGIRLAFVSNCTPWTYLGNRPITTNPGVRHETGLGVFATTKLGLRHGAPLAIALLSPRKAPDTAGSIHADDLQKIVLSCKEPLRFQIDGEYVGRRVQAEFRPIPSALNVVAPALLPN